MSLKHFHVFFILTSLGLMAFLASWFSDRNQAAAGLCGVAFVVGAAYLRRFLRATREVR
jgi:hypothetical protein